MSRLAKFARLSTIYDATALLVWIIGGPQPLVFLLLAASLLLHCFARREHRERDL